MVPETIQLSCWLKHVYANLDVFHLEVVSASWTSLLPGRSQSTKWRLMVFFPGHDTSLPFSRMASLTIWLLSLTYTITSCRPSMNPMTTYFQISITCLIAPSTYTTTFNELVFFIPAFAILNSLHHLPLHPPNRTLLLTPSHRPLAL